MRYHNVTCVIVVFDVERLSSRHQDTEMNENATTLARFSDLLVSLIGNRATSLNLDPATDRLLCTLAQREIVRLVESLLTNQSVFTVKISSGFLVGLNNVDQRDLLHALWSIKTLGVLQIGMDGETNSKISLNVLAESLRNVPLHENPKEFCRLLLKNIRIESTEEVEELAQGLRRIGRVFSVTEVGMGPFVITGVDTKHILDPLIFLMSDIRAHRQVIKVESYSGTSPLISCEASERLMTAFRGIDTVFQRGFPSVLEMSGLALNDSIVAAMASTLQTFSHHLGEVYLFNNPSLTAGGLEFWLRAVDHCETLSSIQFGIEDWDATIKLHVKLNGLGRREAVDNGLYTDRRVWFDWMAELATVERLVQKFHFERYCRDNDALALSSIYLAVRGQPSFVV